MGLSTLITVLIGLAIIGLILWVVDQLNIDPKIKHIMHVVTIFFVVLYLLMLLLQVFGAVGDIGLFRIR